VPVHDPNCRRLTEFKSAYSCSTIFQQLSEAILKLDEEQGPGYVAVTAADHESMTMKVVVERIKSDQ